jgi:hypothetical protein
MSPKEVGVAQGSEGTGQETCQTGRNAGKMSPKVQQRCPANVLNQALEPSGCLLPVPAQRAKPRAKSQQNQTAKKETSLVQFNEESGLQWR